MEEIRDNKEVDNGYKAGKGDLMQNITKIAIEGDLYPKQVGKLKEFHTKQKKQGGGNSITAQVASRSNRTIIKNTRYQ